jgi:hypothetical protein
MRCTVAKTLGVTRVSDETAKMVHMVDKNDDATVASYVRRLQRHLREVRMELFLRPAWLDSPRGPLRFVDAQQRLAETQRNLQAEITKRKATRRRTPEQQQILDTLRVLRWQSRRIGDGVAWQVLVHDRQTLAALANSARVPISSVEDDGARGVFAAAESFLNNKVGIPVVHDITNCLRIGDLTLNALNSNERQFHTLEVKSSRISETRVDDGTTQIQLGVWMTGTETIELLERQAPVGEAGLPLQVPPPRREDRRLAKQVDRMTEAKRRRTASLNEIHDFGGNLTYVTKSTQEAHHHWPQLRKAIRSARKSGYSYFSIDGFVGYAIFYNADRISEDDVCRGSLPGDVMNSIWHDRLRDRNSITVSQIPCKEGVAYAADTMPFTVFEIPLRAKEELVSGKLMISTVANYGRYEEAARELGYEVMMEPDTKDSRSFFLQRHVEWPSGDRTVVEFHAPWREIVIAVHEFTGLAGALRAARSVLELPTQLPLERLVNASISQEKT